MISSGSVGFISAISSLASTVIEAWKTLIWRRECGLDRDQERRILEEQERHEQALDAARFQYLALQQLRTEQQLSELVAMRSVPLVSISVDSASVVDECDILHERLRLDAQSLSELGFDVIFEPVEDSYGLALPMGEHYTFAFLLPPSYPVDPPSVLLRIDRQLDEVPFAPGAWDEGMLLSDVITAIVQRIVFDTPSDSVGKSPQQPGTN